MATQHNRNISSDSYVLDSWISVVHNQWKYREAGSRDLRLDFLRGLCVLIMVVDHVGGDSWLRALTGGNRFFVSAAEGFVFISGLLLGIVYRKVMEREGFMSALKKALHRASTLYLLTFVLTFACSYAAWLVGWAWAGESDIKDPLGFALNALTFQQSYRFTDILVMYTLLIAGAPVGLWLLNRDWTAALLGGSWLLWFLYQVWPEQASQPLPTIAVFHPAAWQIFFVHAMALGFHRQRFAAWLSAIPKRHIFASVTVLFGLLIGLYQSGNVLLDPFMAGDPHVLLESVFLKNPVRIGRIIAALIVFPFAYLLTTYCWTPFRDALGWLLLPLGQHSLYSYTMHLPLMILLALLFTWPEGVSVAESALNSGIQVVAVVALWSMVRHRFLFSVVPQ